MKSNKISFMMVLVIFISIFLYSIGNTKENIDRWVLYDETESGDYYYDTKSVKIIGKNIIRVSDKLKYSKVGKDKFYKLRKKHNQSVRGYDKFDYTINFWELDCRYNPSKFIKVVEYDNQGKILDESDFPNPMIHTVLPGSTLETLHKIVCPK
jgi:hypothetical protein